MTAPSMEDWFGINNIFIRYANSLDHGDVEAVVECFSEDASLESPVLGKFSARLKREGGTQFRHVVSNLAVDVEGDRAHAICYLLDFMTRDGKTELLSPGEYDCTLRKTDGRWRFERRLVAMDRPFRVNDI